MQLNVVRCLLFTNIGHRTCSANVWLTHLLVLSLEDQCFSLLLLFCTCSWSYTSNNIRHLSSSITPSFFHFRLKAHLSTIDRLHGLSDWFFRFPLLFMFYASTSNSWQRPYRFWVVSLLFHCSFGLLLSINSY